jgi:dTDP-4-amino-4,6-dideoxygalactose transaminase
MTGNEQALIADAFASNWVAPLGPHVDAFQAEFAAEVRSPHALALNSGTAALHLALQLSGVQRGDDVFVSTLTFAASANPIRYLGATPVFIDSERRSWNMDPGLLTEALRASAKAGRRPKAVVVVHLYGQCADLDPIATACEEFGVTLIEDAAEALGSHYKGRPPGTFGKAGIFSFNGNKIVNTSGGGMLVSADGAFIAHALKLATQARDPAPHYEHSEVGYNYRLSNVLAAIGRAQLAALGARVAARRANFEAYRSQLGDLRGLHFMPEAPWGMHARWLTTLTIDPDEFGATTHEVREALEAENIEARPVWKPMHLQPVFRDFKAVGGAVSEKLFEQGLCLPSGSSLQPDDLARVTAVVRRVAGKRHRGK